MPKAVAKKKTEEELSRVGLEDSLVSGSAKAEGKPEAPPTPEKENFAPRELPEETIQFKIVNGKLAPPSLRPQRAERIKLAVKESMSDEEFLKWAGISGGVQTPDSFSCPPSLIGGLLDLVANMEAYAFSKKTGLTYEETLRIVAWTQQEHASLDPAGSAIASKYIPASWMKYGDVAVFMSSILLAIKAKSEAVNRYAAAKLEKMGKTPSHDEKKIPAPVPVAVGEVAPVKPNGSSKPLPDLG